MKKIVAFVLMFVLMIGSVSAFAECPTFMPQSVSVTIEQTTCKSMFVVDENHEIVGIRDMRETAIHKSFNVFEYGSYMRGILDDGTVLRGRGLAKLTQTGDYWFGLTPFDVEVEVFTEYQTLVQTIVQNRVAAETLSNPAIIGATVWLDGTYAGHIFYTEYTRRVMVGRVWFVNQKNCYANLWAGDIDGNDELELGFIAGSWYVQPQPNSEPEPDPVPNNPDPNPNPNSSTPTVTVVTTSEEAHTTVTTSTGCGTTVVNTGNGNNITTTSTKVNGNNNTTTVTNNTTNTITLFGITINQNTNTTTTTTNVNGVQTITRPTLMRDFVKNPGPCA